jgi:predicted metal-dependent peptidase
VDFAGFDRRFIGHGMYLEALEGESISVRIAVDTSGSVDSGVLSRFLTEVHEIVRMYPHLEAELFYADTRLYGPFELNPGAIEKPKGGGGTSFEPFFEHFRDSGTPGETTLLIYLTDGYGSFPNFIPEQPALWVVTPGGLPSSEFPFGEVARLRD